MKNGLIALHAPISNGALAGADLPKELKLLNWGDNRSLKGNIRVGAKTLAALAANQTRLQFDKVGLDYEHQSLEGHRNFKASPREYAAYGIPEVREGDGLYLTALDWTPSGQQNARNYADLSPVVLRMDGEVVFLHSVALCPQGAVEGLEFFNADAPQLAALSTTDTSMNADLKKLLTTLFGIDENSDEAAILAAGQTFAEKFAKSAAPEPEALAALSSRLDALAATIDSQRRDALLADALREGKLVPNSARDLPLDKLTALVAELEAGVVPIEKRTPGTVQAEGLAACSASDIAVARQLGLDPKDLVPAK